MDAGTVGAIEALRSDIGGQLAESRRQALILHESLRDDIRMIATAFAQMSGRFDAIDRRFDAIDKRLDAVEVRLDAIDHQLDPRRRPH